MIPRQLDQITEADLLGLVEEQWREGLQLEYKRELSLEGDGKRTLKRAVCAFANTQGGDLIVGVEVDPKDKAVPVAEPPPRGAR
jgi:predicted HTH transcriptional regulator